MIARAALSRALSPSLLRKNYSNSNPFQLVQKRNVSYSKLYLPELITKRPVESRPILVRDFIHESLYNTEYGYFAQNPVVHSLPDHIEFSKLEDQKQYLDHLLQAYSSDSISWLTPVEIFKPFYGAAIARYMTKNICPGRKLNIFEIGGGNGTAARTILDAIRNTNPELYSRCQYTIIEISTLLASKARDQLSAAGHTNWNVVNKSVLDWRDRFDDECFVIVLEVLDNLPHDKVIEWNGKLWQVSVQKAVNDVGEKVFRESFRPISDSLITRCLQYFEQRSLQQKVLSPGLNATSVFSNLIGAALEPAMKMDIFLPTVSMKLLEQLHKCFPRHHAIFADFHHLPSKVPGINAPVVQFKRDNVTVDVGIYLVEEGKCDIFFPTNFNVLQKMYKDICGQESIIYSHRDFMHANAEFERVNTKNGYNPLLQDYTNMSVLTTKKS